MQKVVRDLMRKGRATCPTCGNEEKPRYPQDVEEVLQQKDREIEELKKANFNYSVRIGEYKLSTQRLNSEVKAKANKEESTINNLKRIIEEQTERIETLLEKTVPFRALEEKIQMQAEELEMLYRKLEMADADKEEAIRQVVALADKKYELLGKKLEKTKQLCYSEWLSRDKMQDELEEYKKQTNQDVLNIKARFLQRENDKLTKETQEQKTLIDEMENEIDKMKNEIDELTKENSGLTHRCDKTERLLREVTARKMTLEDELVTCKMLCEHKYEREIATMSATIHLEKRAVENTIAKNLKLEQKCREQLNAIQSEGRSQEKLRKEILNKGIRIGNLKSLYAKIKRGRNRVEPLVVTEYQDALRECPKLHNEIAMMKKQQEMKESEMRVKRGLVKPKVQCWNKAERPQAVELCCRGTRIPDVAPKSQSPGSPPSGQKPPVAWQDNIVLPGVPDTFSS